MRSILFGVMTTLTTMTTITTLFGTAAAAGAEGKRQSNASAIVLSRVAHQTSEEVWDMAWSFHQAGDDESADKLLWTALVGVNCAKHKQNEVKMTTKHTSARAKALAVLEKRRAKTK